MSGFEGLSNTYCDQLAPFHSRKVASTPNGQQLVGEVHQTSLSALGVVLGMCVQNDPFQCRVRPPCPTATANVEFRTCTPFKGLVVPEATLLHAVPFQRRI